MMGTSQWQPFTIADEDIIWASQMIGLGPDGFAKVGNDESRLAAIRNLDSADFEACPGSGKTTLLVAKLAILANRWRWRRQGICVLSHTNAARNEIGTKLSSSPIGGALLRYPHFVGTIHAFVNEFLSVPWLRSKGNLIKAIDTQIALKHRMGLLGRNWKAAMEARHLTEFALMYGRADYTADNKGNLGAATPLARAMVAATKSSSEAGYFCYDEMFVWANELLDTRPEVAAALRERFPLVFIDEAQDNSELQSALLHRLFLEGDNPSRRQRFGDSNQAIYSSVDDKAGAHTDPFPSQIRFDLPRSYRFNQTIANQVKGLGVIPQQLIGAGPGASVVKTEPKATTVILFDDESMSNVLPRYGAHLVEQFTENELRAGVFVAVAGVVKEPEQPDPVPRFIGNYAPTFDPACGRRDSLQTTFAQYLARARFEMNKLRDVSSLVNATASAVLRLADIAGADLSLYSRKSPHRRVKELLDGKAADYNALIELVLVHKGDLSKAEWEESGKALAVSVAKAIAGNAPPTTNAFLAWPEHGSGSEVEEESVATRTDNLFSYPPDGPKVHVRLGSIHSVKGETHTATLVLESYFHDHHLSELKAWLLGARSGGFKKGNKMEGPRLLGRLRLHYVAMTRPSHLLCIAMRKDAFTEAETTILRDRGWLIIDCCSAPEAIAKPT
ncbi:UvrD-helicase domain-containing protein [Rhodopseudomonas palustris]|uniref:DNA 3'-5' helicase II n=1 Tax=Rhodopseudomonas palustris (strain BisB18) TaxID=316056 RepID=Q210V5_RHOPB